MAIKQSKHDLAMCVLAERDLNAALITALEGLFEHCALIHKHWGDGDNTKLANAAESFARDTLAHAKRVQS